MKKRTYYLLALIFSFQHSYCQVLMTKDVIEMELVKSKDVDNVSIVGIRQLKVKSDKLQKTMIKLKIKSTKENKAKLSAFSLLDTVNKIRYRLADYKGYAGFIGYPELIPYKKKQLFNDKGKEIQLGPPFDKNEKDYFDHFDFEGYSNLEIPVNFNTKNNPKLSVVYFGETRYKNFTAELFFTIITEHLDSDFVLYYKDERLWNIKF